MNYGAPMNGFSGNAPCANGYNHSPVIPSTNTDEFDMFLRVAGNPPAASLDGSSTRYDPRRSNALRNGAIFDSIGFQGPDATPTESSFLDARRGGPSRIGRQSVNFGFGIDPAARHSGRQGNTWY